MPTYKRQKGFKKSSEVTSDNIDQVSFDIDKTSSFLETFFYKNQTYIYGTLGAILVLALGYLGYVNYIQAPENNEAFEALSSAKQYFERATSTDESELADSLFNIALDGSDSDFSVSETGIVEEPTTQISTGLLEIIDRYDGTKAANLAKYYAGISYFHLNDYESSIEYLKQFKSEDLFLGSIALGIIGDAYTKQEDLATAITYYKKAAKKNRNKLTTPKYLFKTVLALVKLEDYKKATEVIKTILKDYPFSIEATSKHLQFIIGKIEGITRKPIL